MRLLVSVRSPEEAELAFLGGVDIIDAKEPNRGSLGPVAGGVLARIARRVPREVELSVALGDFTRADWAAQAIEQLPVLRRPFYVKLGFAGISAAETVSFILQSSMIAAGEHPDLPRVIAVAYADANEAASLGPEGLVQLAARSGAAGILIDTHLKDGRSLLDWMDGERMSSLVALARQFGLLSALAGSLHLNHLPVLSRASPEIVGFRSAACAGGREGSVSGDRVAKLRGEITRLNSGFLQPEPRLDCYNPLAQNA